MMFGPPFFLSRTGAVRNPRLNRTGRYLFRPANVVPPPARTARNRACPTPHRLFRRVSHAQPAPSRAAMTIPGPFERRRQRLPCPEISHPSPASQVPSSIPSPEAPAQTHTQPAPGDCRRTTPPHPKRPEKTKKRIPHLMRDALFRRNPPSGLLTGLLT